jgi:hypothetical protein
LRIFRYICNPIWLFQSTWTLRKGPVAFVQTAASVQLNRASRPGSGKFQVESWMMKKNIGPVAFVQTAASVQLNRGSRPRAGRFQVRILDDEEKILAP